MARHDSKSAMEIILDQKYRFSPEMSKTNFSVPFTLRKDYQSMIITCQYVPKEVSDLTLCQKEIEAGLQRYIPASQMDEFGNWQNYLPLMNFITLSLNFGSLYIGCAHRHASTQLHVISSKKSSPGFIPHTPQTGSWRAVLNIHAAISDPVEYSLQILGLTTGETPND